MIASEYQLEEIGRTLTERAVDVYQMDGVEIVSRWFHSSNDCDLMVWLDGDNLLVRFQFNISGQIVDWNKHSGFRTGLIVETEYASAGAKDALTSETISYDKLVSGGAIRTAEQVLLAACEIRAPWREKMVRLLSAGSGNRTAIASRESRTRFWSRFKHWMTG